MLFKIKNNLGFTEIAAPVSAIEYDFGLKIEFNKTASIIIDASLTALEWAMNDAAKDRRAVLDVTPEGVENINAAYPTLPKPNWAYGGSMVQKRSAP